MSTSEARQRMRSTAAGRTPVMVRIDAESGGTTAFHGGIRPDDGGRTDRPYRPPGVHRFGDMVELTRQLVNIGAGDNFLGVGGVVLANS